MILKSSLININKNRHFKINTNKIIKNGKSNGFEFLKKAL